MNEALYFSGSYHLYVYHNDAEKCKDAPDNVGWDFAQKELAESEGIDQLNKAMDENGGFVSMSKPQ